MRHWVPILVLITGLALLTVGILKTLPEFQNDHFIRPPPPKQNICVDSLVTICQYDPNHTVCVQWREVMETHCQPLRLSYCGPEGGPRFFLCPSKFSEKCFVDMEKICATDNVNEECVKWRKISIAECWPKRFDYCGSKNEPDVYQSPTSIVGGECKHPDCPPVPEDECTKRMDHICVADSKDSDCLKWSAVAPMDRIKACPALRLSYCGLEGKSQPWSCLNELKDGLQSPRDVDFRYARRPSSTPSAIPSSLPTLVGETCVQTMNTICANKNTDTYPECQAWNLIAENNKLASCPENYRENCISGAQLNWWCQLNLPSGGGCGLGRCKNADGKCELCV